VRITDVYLCLLYDFFVIKNADSHVSVCLDKDQIWVVNEITEKIFLQLKDVGEGL